MAIKGNSGLKNWIGYVRIFINNAREARVRGSGIRRRSSGGPRGAEGFGNGNGEKDTASRRCHHCCSSAAG